MFARLVFFLLCISRKMYSKADRPKRSRDIRKSPRSFSFRLHCFPFSLHSRHGEFSLSSLFLSREHAVIISRLETKIDRYFLAKKNLIVRTMQDDLEYSLLPIAVIL